ATPVPRAAWQGGRSRVIVLTKAPICGGFDAFKRHAGPAALSRESPDTGGLPMSDAVKVGFVPFSAAPRGILVVFCDDTLKFGVATRKTLGAAADLVKRAAASSQFKGKSGSSLDILAPEGIKIQRLIVLGLGKPAELKQKDFLKFGGVLAGKLNAASEAVTVIAELPE